MKLVDSNKKENPVRTSRRAEYFDALGEKFETYMSEYDVERRQFLIFSTLCNENLLRGRKVLEVGCGTGRFSEQIVKRGGQLTVLDIGPNLVHGVSRNLSCPGVVGDACHLPFKNENFDAIMSSECIEHTRDPVRAIREMCRVCRPSGVVCLTTPNKLWYPILLFSQKLGLRKFSGIENWIFPGRAARVMREEGMVDIMLGGCHLWPFQLKCTRTLLRRFDRMGKKLYPLMINFGIIGRKGVRC